MNIISIPHNSSYNSLSLDHCGEVTSKYIWRNWRNWSLLICSWSSSQSCLSVNLCIMIQLEKIHPKIAALFGGGACFFHANVLTRPTRNTVQQRKKTVDHGLTQNMSQLTKGCQRHASSINNLRSWVNLETSRSLIHSNIICEGSKVTHKDNPGSW